MAREAAARSIVLLENRNNTLPLAPSVRRLAVVGPMADDLPVLTDEVVRATIERTRR